MSLPTKPFDNKRHYDPGRLRHKIKFVQDVTVSDGFGGSEKITDSLVIETFAGKEEVSEWTQGQINAGETQYDSLHYFVIRNRNGFYPAKDMRIIYGELKYIILKVKMLDDPCTFLKVLVSAVT